MPNIEEVRPELKPAGTAQRKPKADSVPEARSDQAA